MRDYILPKSTKFCLVGLKTLFRDLNICYRCTHLGNFTDCYEISSTEVLAMPQVEGSYIVEAVSQLFF